MRLSSSLSVAEDSIFIIQRGTCLSNSRYSSLGENETTEGEQTISLGTCTTGRRTTIVIDFYKHPKRSGRSFNIPASIDSKSSSRFQQRPTEFERAASRLQTSLFTLKHYFAHPLTTYVHRNCEEEGQNTEPENKSRMINNRGQPIKYRFIYASSNRYDRCDP